MASSFEPKGRGSRKQIFTEYGNHLVYAEGEKTEPLYVENIKKIINNKFKFIICLDSFEELIVAK